MGKGERPEHAAPPDVFYNEEEARKYTSNSRMIEIQVNCTIAANYECITPKGGYDLRPLILPWLRCSLA